MASDRWMLVTVTCTHTDNGNPYIQHVMPQLTMISNQQASEPHLGIRSSNMELYKIRAQHYHHHHCYWVCCHREASSSSSIDLLMAVYPRANHEATAEPELRAGCEQVPSLTNVLTLSSFPFRVIKSHQTNEQKHQSLRR